MVTALLLAAIAIVESNNNDFAVGKAGEVSRYQFLQSTWDSYASELKHYNLDGSAKNSTPACKHCAYAVAVLHLESIKNAHWKSKRDSVLWTAAAWNCGSTGVKRTKYQFSKLPKSTQRYALKVRKEYERLREQTN